MNNDIFGSSKRRIQRANEHFRELATIEKAFFSKKPYVQTVEPNADGTLQQLKVKFTEKIPGRYVDLTMEAAEALRAALDHLGYAAAVASGHVNPSSGTYFPFASSPSELERAIKERSKKIPPNIVTVFRGFNPYPGGNDPLCALNKICGASKHRLVTPLAMTSGGVRLNMVTATGTFDLMPPTWDRDKNEMLLAEFTPSSRINYDANVSFCIGFDRVPIAKGQPVLDAINVMGKSVAAVFDKTEAEAKRLGLA